MVQSRTKVRVASKGAIKALGLAGALTSVVIAPGTAILWKELEKHNNKLKRRRKDANRTIIYLKYRSIVEVRKNSDGQFTYRLTAKGLDSFQKIIIDELEIPKPARWDKKWRLVMFDIPKGMQPKRAFLLNKLWNLGFYKIQDSAWIHPFDCEKQIGALIDYLHLNQYVSYLEVNRANFENHATQHFKQKGLLV